MFVVRAFSPFGQAMSFPSVGLPRSSIQVGIKSSVVQYDEKRMMVWRFGTSHFSQRFFARARIAGRTSVDQLSG